MEGPTIQEPRALVISYRTIATGLGALIVAAAIGVLVWQFAFASSPSSPPGIRLSYPNNWGQVSPATIPGAPPNADLAIARKNGKGVVVVIRNGPLKLDANTVTTLEKQLRAKYSDFRPLRSEFIQVRAGRALLLSYERTKQGQHGELDTITIIPAGRLSFVLDTTSPAGNAKIDHELQGIIASAQLTHP